MSTQIIQRTPTVTGSAQSGWTITIPDESYDTTPYLLPFTYKVTASPLTISSLQSLGNYRITASGSNYQIKRGKFVPDDYYQIMPSVSASTRVGQEDTIFVGASAYAQFDQGDGPHIGRGSITTAGVNVIVEYPSITFLDQTRVAVIINYSRVVLYLPIG